jgi:hypothetical protein
MSDPGFRISANCLLARKNHTLGTATSSLRALKQTLPRLFLQFGHLRKVHNIPRLAIYHFTPQRFAPLQPQSVTDKSTCCPSCGKAGIRLVAFTDPASVLHIICAGPMPCDSSWTLFRHPSAPQSIHAFRQISLDALGLSLLSSCRPRSLPPA